MRLRTILVAVPAALLLTTALTAGAQSAAAGTAVASRPGTAPTTLTFSNFGSNKSPTGIVLTAGVGGPNPVTKVTAALWPINTSSLSAVTVPLVLQSGTAADGEWQTSGPLGLTDGEYQYRVEAVDSAGTVVDTWTPNLLYYPSAVMHDLSVNPAATSYSHPDVTVTGRLTEYDPARGDTGTPYNSSSTPVQLAWNNGGGFVGLNSDGTFSDHLFPGPDPWINVYVNTPGSHDSYPPLTVPSTLSTTRILLDRTTSTGAVVNTTLHVTGTVQYQDDSGVWKPLPTANVTMSGGVYVQGQTDANGRFDLAAPTPDASHGFTDAWTVQTGGGFMRPSSATFTISDVIQQITLGMSAPLIDEFGALTFHYSADSTDLLLPQSRIYVLESPDGRTGWRSIGYLKVFNDVHDQLVTMTVDNPHGYWKLWYEGDSAHTAAYSNVIHTFRYATLVTGGKPNTTRAHRGQTLSFSGRLWAQGMGSWFRMKGAKVLLAYRLPGSNQWHVAASARTTSSGFYLLRAPARTNAYWAVFFLTPNEELVDTMGPLTLVHVRR